MSEDCWSDPEACPIPDAWTRTFHARSGREYRIQVRVPADVAPAGGFPTLYVLDGDDLFGIAAEAARMLANWRPASRVWPGIVVGIGYHGATRRAFDYTPSPSPASGAGTDPGGGVRRETSGGAAELLDMLQNELLPALHDHCPIDPEQQTLFGHSYGGLFALYAYFTAPAPFRTIIASSPSIWWKRRSILEYEYRFRALHTPDRVHTQLALSVGSAEQPMHLTPEERAALSPEQAARRSRQLADARMVDNARELFERLHADGFRCDYRLFAEESHMSVTLAALAAAIARVFGPPGDADRG